MQTEIEVTTEEKQNQTEKTNEDQSIQTEIEVITEEKQNQTEETNEDQSIQTEIEVTMEEKQNQTEKTNEDQSIQTEIEVTTEEKENQTEKNNAEQSIQREVHSEDKSNETDINNSNILTVYTIELVENMQTWGTQTDVAELEAMDPITPVPSICPTDYVEQIKDNMKYNLSKTDSVVSSASELEDSQKQRSKAAGLDMRMGEYHELDFPPVSSTNVALKHMDTVMKERTPSLEDLCTRCDVSASKKKKKVKISPEKC